MKNPHRRVALKMSYSTAGELLLQLNLSQKFICAFYGEDSSLMLKNRALYSAVKSSVEHIDDKQIVVFVDDFMPAFVPGSFD